MRSTFADQTLGVATEQYRRVSDNKIFVVENRNQLPCQGSGECVYEYLATGEHVSVTPSGLTPAPGGEAYTPTAEAKSRALGDVALEAGSLLLMGGGCLAAGYAIGKRQPVTGLAGAMAVLLGAGLRVAILWPWIRRLGATMRAS
jgi:hypothetical protein